MLLQLRDANRQRVHDIVHFDYTKVTAVHELAAKCIEDSEIWDRLEGWEQFISDPSNDLEFRHLFHVIVPENADMIALVPDDFHRDISLFRIEFLIKCQVESTLLKVIEDELLSGAFAYDQSWLAPYDMLSDVSHVIRGRALWDPYNYEEDFTYVTLELWLEQENFEGDRVDLPMRWYHRLTSKMKDYFNAHVHR